MIRRTRCDPAGSGRAPFGPVAGVALAALCVFAGSAARAQDGGVRSHFSAGGGLRGLAMGGAQTSIVADAEALDWNPAGLGMVRRTELLLGRTSYFGADVVESQVTGVVPSWRFGAIALGVRHLGVGGVEGRDDRNQVTDADLGASALQATFGYGRSLAGWSLGGTLDIAREQVAGTGATGFGLDLGMQLRPTEAFLFAPEWMEGISAGAAWMNVVEPRLRLDEDTVVDPAGFRLGFGYARPFLSGGGFVAAVDVETSSVTDTRLHTGVELRLHPAVALRSGVGRHGLTAGAGLHWRDLDVDYALDDTDLGSVHRVGLSWAFGGTTDDRRLAFVARQEEELQSRLEEASARREEERIVELLRETDALRASGRIEDALATIDVARTLAPDRGEAIDLEARCWMDRGRAFEAEGNLTDAALAYAHVLALQPEEANALEAQQRVQTESDRRAKREAHLREQFAAALDAFGRGDLLAARQGFASLAKEKRDAEAQAMLRRTEDAIARKAGDHLEQSRRLLARNLLAEAAEELGRARTYAPDLAGIASVEAELVQRRDRDPLAGALPTTGAAGTSRGTPSGDDRRSPADTGRDASAAAARMDATELADLYRRGIEASQASRSEDAIRYFELVFSASPGHSLVRENLVREYLTLGMERFAAGDLDEAIGIWQRAIEVDPNDEKARGYLERALRHKNRSEEILGRSR